MYSFRCHHSKFRKTLKSLLIVVGSFFMGAKVQKLVLSCIMLHHLLVSTSGACHGKFKLRRYVGLQWWDAKFELRIKFRLMWYCLPDSSFLCVCSPETLSRVTLAMLGVGLQPVLGELVGCRSVI